MTSPTRVGLFGGSFDPIHLGHLIMAEHARAQLNLDQVLFAPAGSPPHKAGHYLAPIPDRLEMVRRAIAGNEAFACTDLDIDHTQPSFTWRLLERLRDRHPATHLWFIMGGDSLAEFHSWARPERILELARLAVVERPGFDMANALLASPQALRDAVDHVGAPLCAISSTEIRDRVLAGTTVRYLVPEPVRLYIADQGLYRS